MPDASRVQCLLVDDLEENLLALEALLRGDGVEILQARSGPEALELLLVHDVALALLDVQMPGMDGFELAELMRGMERTRHVPIIFVTAGARDRQRLFKGYDTGAVDFLHKPLEPHILRNKAGVFFQLHRQKQQLARQMEELAETLRLNEMFTAVLGHDLRNPLNAILASAELLQRRTPDEAVRKTASRMLTSGTRMSRLIDDMLDLARGRLAGGIGLRRARLDFGQLVRRIVQEQQAAWPGRVIELSWQGDLEGQWDEDRLAQVVSNLLGNALQHGTPTRPVHVRVEATPAERVRLSVENAGVIPAELIPFLFDPFRGTERPRGRGEGLGLGLYIVQQLVQAHQGHVDVQTVDTLRTRFQVELPRG